jgi:mono/diheme cytochrome c family protein
MSSSRINASLVGLTVFLATLTACKHEKPNVMYMPHMVDSPAIKAQEKGSMMLPVKGTVPRGFVPYAYLTDPEGAGRDLINPLRRTADVMARGKVMFDTYCLVCHGPGGDGDGTIVPKFPRPPVLYSDKVVGWSDGRIYHVITVGQNLMPSYSSQIDSGDRWAIIHYLRALQKAKKPTAEDVKSAQLGQ